MIVKAKKYITEWYNEELEPEQQIAFWVVLVGCSIIGLGILTMFFLYPTVMLTVFGVLAVLFLISAFIASLAILFDY